MTTPQDVEELLAKAKASTREQKYDSAAAQYREVLTLDERNVAAHEGIAAIAFLGKDYDVAIEHFKRVTLIDPRRAQALINLGAVYNRKEDYNNAVQTLRKALAKDRKSPEAYYNLGIAHRGLKQWSMAVSAYKEAIRLKPEMAEAYQNLANVFVEMGNTHQAILHYQRALDIRPDFDRAIRGLERARNAKKVSDEAISPFGRLVDMDKVKKVGETTDVRQLTDQERYEDRVAVHTHAKDTQQAGQAVLDLLQSQLEPRLNEFTRAFNQSRDPHGYWTEFESLTESMQALANLVDEFEKETDRLRDHEREMSEGPQTPSGSK
ncbi:MAG: tetratricopeptide repeat protein [Planctomycetaceae bacterium]|nr:tetratricopeptide repeat protein [Planctomycetaceae bacterium]